MTDSDIEWLMRNGSRRRVPKGTLLIRQGEPTDSLFFLLEGELAVSTQTGTIAVLKTGEVVGEISLVDSRPPTASVTALVDSEMGVVPRRQVSAKLRDDLSFAAHFYQAIAIFLADRLRTTTANLAGKKQNSTRTSKTLTNSPRTCSIASRWRAIASRICSAVHGVRDRPS